MNIEEVWANILSSSLLEEPPFRAAISKRNQHSSMNPEPASTPIPRHPAHNKNFTLRSPTDCIPPIMSTGQEDCIFGPRNSLVPPGASDHGLSSRTKESRKRGHGALNADKALTTRSKAPKETRKRPKMYKRRKRYLPSTSRADISEDDIFEVESLVFHRTASSVETSQVEYLICWAGDWPLVQRYTWEPEENILNATLVGDYWRRLFDIDFAEQETA